MITSETNKLDKRGHLNLKLRVSIVGSTATVSDAWIPCWRLAKIDAVLIGSFDESIGGGHSAKRAWDLSVSGCTHVFAVWLLNYGRGWPISCRWGGASRPLHPPASGGGGAAGRGSSGRCSSGHGRMQRRNSSSTPGARRTKQNRQIKNLTKRQK